MALSIKILISEFDNISKLKAENYKTEDKKEA